MIRLAIRNEPNFLRIFSQWVTAAVKSRQDQRSVRAEAYRGKPPRLPAKEQRQAFPCQNLDRA